MNKRWLLIGSIVILIILIALVALRIKRPSVSGLSEGTKTISVSSLSGQAKNLEAKGNLIEAKAIYQRLINESPRSSEVMNWQKKIEELNIKILFSTLITPQGILYEIQPGDTLTKIAKQFNTTADLIMKSNGLKDDKILPGRKIKVWIGAFSIVVDKSQKRLS